MQIGSGNLTGRAIESKPNMSGFDSFKVFLKLYFVKSKFFWLKKKKNDYIDEAFNNEK